MTTPTMITMTETTDTTEKTMRHNPPASTSSDRQPRMQSTDDTVDHDHGTTTTPTAIPTNETTETTEKTRSHDHPAIAYTAKEPQPLMQSTTGFVDNDNDIVLLLATTTRQTTMPMTGTTETTQTTMNHAPPAIAPTANKPQSPKPPTAETANDAKDDFGLMIPMTLLLHTSPTNPTQLPDYHVSNSATTTPTTHHSKTTIHWIRKTFAPVFKALDCLELAIVQLSDNLFAATSNIRIAEPPMPPTPNPQPHRIQPQFPYPSSHKQQPKETLSGNAPKLCNSTQIQTLQQTLHIQQTHHRHRNHTKHRDLLCPPLPIVHYNFRKRLSLPVHIRIPTYHRYLANNFQPP